MEQYTYDILYQVEETHWWFVGRRHVILDQISLFYDQEQQLDVLDIGCGTGIFLEALQHYGQVTGLDFSPHALRFCRKREFSQLVRGAAENLPFPANTFDIITANDLLEHLNDDLASAQEFLHVLKPGGRLFLFVPACQFLWSLQDEISHHKRRYTLSQLSQLLDKAGYTVEKMSYANTFLFPLIFVGRQLLKIMRRLRHISSENTLHPGWSNPILAKIFSFEAWFLRRIRFPFGVSIIAVCRKPL